MCSRLDSASQHTQGGPRTPGQFSSAFYLAVGELGLQTQVIPAAFHMGSGLGALVPSVLTERQRDQERGGGGGREYESIQNLNLV